MNFEIILTNYTAEIKSEFNIKSSKNNIEKRAFIAFQKIKKDLKEFTANEIPQRSELNTYFETNETTILKLNHFNLTGIHNIDLTAAYLTILKNDGFISLETFNYCFNILNKKERLQCIGMLAAKKNLFKYENGELVNFQEKKSETEGVFFWCVDRTARIISDMRHLMSDHSFIFSWVDSIYYLDENNTPVLEKYLLENNLKYKYKYLENVRVKEFKNFYLLQHSHDENKNTFHLPKKENQYTKDLLKFLKLM